MSIFDISEKTDFFFDKLWHVWPQSWGDQGKAWSESSAQLILDRLAQDSDMWQNELCFAVAATRPWDGVRKKHIKQINITVLKLASLARSIFPEYPYMSIRIGSNVSGGDGIFCPDIEVRLDTKYFGFDPSIEKGWRERYPEVCFHIGHHSELYYKHYDGAPGLPYPKARDWINLPKTNYSGHRVPEEYFFFPENDPPKGWRGINMTSELLKFQSRPDIF